MNIKIIDKVLLLCFVLACCIFMNNKTEAKEIKDGTYYIKSAINENYVIDVTNKSKANAANIELWTYNGGTNQQFEIKKVDEKYYTIKSVNSNKYMDVDRALKTNGTNVLQYEYLGNNNQKWKIRETEDGYINIISKDSGRLIDIENSKIENGSNILIWDNNGGFNQKFKLEGTKSNPVESGTYKIVSAKDSSYVLDVTANSIANNANIEIWKDNEGNNQKFNVKMLGNGTYEISSVLSNKYMDVDHGLKSRGTNILQYDYNNSVNQKWILKDCGDGYCYIVSKANGLYVDIEGGNMSNGTNVFTWTYNGGDNQKFMFIPTTYTDNGRSSQFKREHPEIKIGIDVSKYQGTIDWNAVKRDGIDYVMIRAGFRGYGASGSLNEDPKLDEYARGARAAGLDVGIYFFSQATNYQEGVEEANYTIGLIRKYDITYPVAFDTEDSSSPDNTGRADGIDVQARTDAAKGFCSTIKKSGYKTLIYASPSWIKDNLYINQLSEYDVWLANYTGATQEDPLKKPTNYKGKYVMWQYTDAGTVNGIKGKVDCDLFYYLK